MGKSNYELGREHFLRKEYKEAVRLFTLGVGDNTSPACMMQLGRCFEEGLGVSKDLVEARQLYQDSYNWITVKQRDGETGQWLRKKLELLKNVPQIPHRTRFYKDIGNVKVIRTRNGGEVKTRFNTDETVITMADVYPFERGFRYAETKLSAFNKEWTCDGHSRFHDGYHLKTDLFELTVRRGSARRYQKLIDERRGMILFPDDLNLNYLCSQENILEKVKDLIFDIAQEVIPPVLERVSKRINVPYGKCIVARSLRNLYAFNANPDHDITFAAQCVQLPIESLEALCVHELTHNFVNDHNKDFYDKMEELGGKEVFDLEIKLFDEGKWPYIRM